MENQVMRRIRWLDISKGLLMVTIVLMHIVYVGWTSILGNFIFNFTSIYEVSVFFVLSGFLLSDMKLKSPKSFVVHKIRTLYFRIVIIGCVAVWLHNVLLTVGFYSTTVEYDGKSMHIYSFLDFIKQTLATLLCMGREVITGPLWFGYVLFLAFCILSIITFLCYRLPKRFDTNATKMLVVFVLMLLSLLATEVFKFTIPRVNNVLTACFCLALGQWMYSAKRVQFDNTYLFVGSVLILIALSFSVKFAFNNNDFSNPAILLVALFAGTYMVCYLSKYIEKIRFLSGSLMLIGKNSLAIMAGQLIAFKFGTFLINKLTAAHISTAPLCPLAPNLGLLVYYLIIGIVFPLFASLLVKKVCVRLHFIHV